jgi:zinc and cadmium transporter
MNERPFLLLLLGLTAALANLVGGSAVSFRSEIRQTVLNVLVSLGAGFMLAASMLEVIPRSLELNGSLAMIIVLGGYLFVHLVEHTISTHFHFGEETHGSEIVHRGTAYSAVVGLSLHAFFDGALIAAGFWISVRFGLLMFMAIILHKIPEGFTAASIMRASGRGKVSGMVATIIVGCSTLAGILSISSSQRFGTTALPFSAGVTLYVAASDLIPEVNKQPGFAVSVGVFLGVMLFYLTDSLLEAVL